MMTTLTEVKSCFRCNRVFPIEDLDLEFGFCTSCWDKRAPRKRGIKVELRDPPDLLFIGLFQELPLIGSVFTKEQRDIWLRCAEGIMKVLYREVED